MRCFAISLPQNNYTLTREKFESQLVAEVCKIFNIHKSCTTPYNPQMVERFNCTLLGMLATTTKEHPFDWENQIRKVCMAYNTSVHATTGYTPFYLMFGREARLPADLIFGTPSPAEQTPDMYTRSLKQSLEKAYERVRQMTAAAMTGKYTESHLQSVILFGSILPQYSKESLESSTIHGKGHSKLLRSCQM